MNKIKESKAYKKFIAFYSIVIVEYNVGLMVLAIIAAFAYAISNA